MVLGNLGSGTTHVGEMGAWGDSYMVVIRVCVEHVEIVCFRGLVVALSYVKAKFKFCVLVMLVDARKHFS
jgi:hypothetical protein